MTRGSSFFHRFPAEKWQAFRRGHSETVAIREARITLELIEVGQLYWTEFGERVGSGQRVLATIRVQNLSRSKIIHYHTYRDKFANLANKIIPELTDEHGNKYHQGDGSNKRIATGSKDLYPGESTTDVIAFALPVKATDMFTLTLPASHLYSDDI